MTQTVSRSPWLVFTDLDGTLLDHDSYTWQPAAAWLARLAEAGIAVIPTTSKTRQELLSLRDDLGLEATPFIAENGAVIGLPASWQHARLDRDPAAPDGLIVKTPSLDIGFIRRRLAVLRDRLDVRFRGMGELSLDTICELTALSADKARQASVEVEFQVFDDVPHAWHNSEQHVPGIPEVWQALGRIGDFFRCHTNSK